MHKDSPKSVSLSFDLDVVDGWPPVAVESLPFIPTADGYLALVPPLFVKNLSVGDIIEAILNPKEDRVKSWRHISKSGNTTVWILRLKHNEGVSEVLKKLRNMGCNTVDFEQSGIYSVDIPETVQIGSVDAELEKLDTQFFAVAYPSMRHPE